MYKLSIKIENQHGQSTTIPLHTEVDGRYCSGIELAEHLVGRIHDDHELGVLAEMAEEVVAEMDPDD